MLRPAVAATFWKGKTNRAELEGYASDARALLARMDADGIERVGLINYVSPDLMGFTADANPWMIEYARADPSRLIAFGSVNPRFTADVAGETSRIIDRGARAIKVHPPHQLFRANAYQDALPALADLYRVAQDAQVRTDHDALSGGTADDDGTAERPRLARGGGEGCSHGRARASIV